MGYPEDNLKKKGADANPNGAPMGGQTWKDLYEKHLVKNPGEFIQPRTNKELIVMNDVKKATEGNDTSINRIQDRTEGKATQKVEFGNSEADEQLKRLREALDKDENLGVIQGQQPTPPVEL